MKYFKMVSLKFLHIFLSAFYCATVVTGEVFFKSGSPRVKLTNGAILSGSLANSRDGRPFTSFVGIPYATIPERFAESQLITEPWEGVKEAVKPGAMCAQNQFDSEGQIFGEEDCLNLNVYVAMNNTGSRKGLPVMVWIHGGGFAFGGGLGYGPRFFMDEDVILVTFNYRVGVYGFLSTGDEVIPGNNGLKDQVTALRWVQENIQNFGGDPARVTIFGESAGGVSVHYLMLSPLSKGLFHRAISQSGTSYASLWSFDPNPRKTAVKLATHLNCPTTSATPEEITSQEILTCLRGLPLEELSKAQRAFKESWPSNLKSFHFVPTKEPEGPNAFLTQSPWSIVQDKNQPLLEVPWMVGATEDEGTGMYAGVVLKDAALTKELDTEWNTVAPKVFDYDHLPQEEQNIVSEKIRQFYFGTKAISKETRENLTNLYSDQMILHSTFRAAVDTASRGKMNRVYLYQYAHKGPISLMGMTLKLNDESLAKVGHGDEVVFQFDFGSGIPGMKEFVKADSPDEEFSKNFVKLWTTFASQGEPKHSWGAATYRKWKSISKKEIDGVYPFRWYRIEQNPTFIDNPYKERLQFWDDLWRDHFAPALESQKVPVPVIVEKTEL